MGMEDMMSYINDDELVEVTPQSLRLRKKLLTAQEREIAKKQAKKSAEG
jgi:GTP-binding protein